MARLGERTDQKPNRAALTMWTHQFMSLYATLQCDIRGIQHHQKRIRTIERRLQDSALMEQYPEGSEGRTEAQNVLALHRSGLELRDKRVKEITWQFPAFWKNRPDGADQWLRSDWFAFATSSDDVCEFMHNTGIDPCWKEVHDQWQLRESPLNREECPY